MRASSVISTIFFKCSLEATSGTTPPYFEWYNCDEIIFDNILSLSRTAADVSSQEVSIASVINCLL